MDMRKFNKLEGLRRELERKIDKLQYIPDAAGKEKAARSITKLRRHIENAKRG